MPRVLTIIGARPQFVKAAVVSAAIQARDGGLSETLVHTGQHFDGNMSDIFFRQLGLPSPDVHLGIGGGSHGQNTGRMIEALERVIVEHRPDVVLVYGDTDSTLAGAIAASKLHVPIAHVEAGLRSFNRRMPEELNRVLTDHASAVLFAPTLAAVKNLRREGIDETRIHLVGDVMFDAVLTYREHARAPSQELPGGGFILATIHRAENTESPGRLSAIISALEQLGRHTPVVLPLHPRTRDRLATHAITVRHITLCEPVGYFEMLWLLERCAAIVTDSGGLQKEAFFFSKPCVTTRDETEWVELVDLGWNRLVGADSQRIIEEVAAVLSSGPGSIGVGASPGTGPVSREMPFGRGDAGQAIATVLSAR